MKDPEQIYLRYMDLKAYIDWTDDDVGRVSGLAALFEPHLAVLVDDFYAMVAGHSEARKIFAGGPEEAGEIKVALLDWLRDLLTGPYDRDYGYRRWKVGARQADIGLAQVYTNVALSRIRDGLVRLLGESWTADLAGLIASIRSLNKLLDLDLAQIEDAYHAEYAAHLKGSERLATLGQIAGGVAHELRNPLNVVKTSLYYLTNARTPNPEKQAEHMRRIGRSVTRADEVITTLTNFARFPDPEAKPFDFEAIVREALEESAPPAGAEVSVDFPADFPLALADRDQIRIVLSNLIRNAVDAMPSGGTLALVGRRGEEGIEVDVSDSGVGIAAADLGRIMEPLFSTKTRGIGLGLALSRMILGKNHGSLTVVSELGRGSTFTIRLPMAPIEEGILV